MKSTKVILTIKSIFFTKIIVHNENNELFSYKRTLKSTLIKDKFVGMIIEEGLCLPFCTLDRMYILVVYRNVLFFRQILG